MTTTGLIYTPKEVVTKHGYPIKVVFSHEGKEIIIITAYPLKRGLRK